MVRNAPRTHGKVNKNLPSLMVDFIAETVSGGDASPERNKVIYAWCWVERSKIQHFMI